MKLSESQKDVLYSVAQQALITVVHGHGDQTEAIAWRNAAKKLIGHQGTITSLMKRKVLDGQCDITELGIEEAKKIYANTTHRDTVKRQSWDDAVVESRQQKKEIEEAREAREDEWNEYLASLPELPGYQSAQGYPFSVRWRSVEFARTPDISIEDKRAPHGAEDRYHEAEWVFSGGAVSYMETEALGDYIAALTAAKEIMESLIEKYKDDPVKSYV